MKHINIIICLFIFAGIAHAQEKVIEKSDKKTPSWVNGLEKDFIITAGSASTINEAKQKALLSVKENIVSSIAVYVQASTDQQVSESVKNNIVSYNENFLISTKTETADLPFLKGVSLNKADEYYWEKVMNKKDKSIKYYYHIKYPFPEFELRKMVFEFEKQDKKLNTQLYNILESIDTLSSVNELTSSLGELRVLAGYFKDQRKATTAAGIIKIESILGQIRIVPIKNQAGYIEFALKKGNQSMSCSTTPKCTSNCATITAIKTNALHWIIEYDYSGCYKDDLNYIQIKFLFAGIKCDHKFLLDLSGETVDLIIDGGIYLNVINASEGQLGKSSCTMQIFSKTDAPFEIKKLILKWDNLHPITINNINKLVSKKGLFELNLQIDQELNEEYKNSGKKVVLVSCTIVYTKILNGITDETSLYGVRIISD